MNLQGLLSQVLKSGSTIAQQGQGALEKGLNVPKSGNERDAMMSGLGKGALAGGALSLLLGTKAGRHLGEGAAKAGGVALLGTLAYKAYQGWQEKNGQTQIDDSFNKPALTQSEEQKTGVVLQAMIAAAKADGHVDEDEKKKIQDAVQAMGATTEVNQFVQQELDKPLDPAEVAGNVKNAEEAAEVYLASLIVVDEQNFMEKAYLKELAVQLKLEPGLVAELEAKVAAV